MNDTLAFICLVLVVFGFGLPLWVLWDTRRRLRRGRRDTDLRKVYK